MGKVCLMLSNDTSVEPRYPRKRILESQDIPANPQPIKRLTQKPYFEPLTELFDKGKYMKNMILIAFLMLGARHAFATGRDATLTAGTTPEQLLKNSQRILFLGDSITQGGNYVANFDAWLVKTFPNQRFTVINGGLSSETVSGLSEDNHAGGKFPRPCLFERLERVLAKTKPDLIIACYGMNCGIYKELNEERYARYRYGILRLRAAAQQYGTEVVHVTPPIFDNHGKAGFDYDSVLTTYAEWLVDQREQGWHVADLHSEMRAKVDQIKKQDPEFTVQKDRVHPNGDGHWMMAQCLIAYFGDPASAQVASAKELLDGSRLNAITQRMRSYQKAIHAETKPLRPGVPKEGSLESAAAEAKQLEERIYLKKQLGAIKVEQPAAQLQSEGTPSD